MSMIGASDACDPVSQQNNFNPSWMGQTFNASSGVPRPTGRPNASNGGEGEEDRPMAAPIFMRNRYGREDILALFDGGSVHPPDDFIRCPIVLSELQSPCVVKPLTDTEKKLRENINSSKAMSLLSATDRHHISSGGALPESPQSANRNNANGWTHVQSRDHNKTWGRTASTTSTTPVRGSVRGAFTGGRGGGIAGGGVEGVVTAPYGGVPQNGERALGTGGTFPSRRGVNPVGRGGSTANSYNSRAQGLYNPHDPSDRPRQRGRSTSEEAEGGATPTTPGAAQPATAAAAAGVATGGMSAQGTTWQSRQTAWGRGGEQQRMPEWAHDDDGGMGGGISREQSTEVSSGTFDDQGRFMAGRGPFPRGAQPQQHHQTTAGQSMQHDQQYVQQQQRVSPPSTAAWGGSEERAGGVPHTTPMEIPSHSSSHYSTGGSAPQMQQQPDLQSGASGMSPSSAFLYAYQQQQLQQQHFAAMQQAQQQPPQSAAPPKPVQFFYLDPNRVERGPFTLDQMEAWFNMGYFQNSLEVRRECDTQFTELGELQKRNGKNPFKFPEPTPAPVMPTPNMLAGYMDHQMGLGNGGGWEQSVQSIFARAQTTSSYEALMEKQRMDEQARRMIEEREQMIRMQEMMQRQAETEREKKERELKEKEIEIQRKHEEMLVREREMEASKRQHELILAEQKKEIEKKRNELEATKNRELAEKRAKEESEQKKKEEIEERKRIEEQRKAAEEEAEREKERAKKRAEEAKKLMEEEKKRQEAERKMAEAYAKAEELRLEAEREQAAEKERQAQIAAARKAAAPAATAPVWDVPTPNASGNTTPIVLPKAPSGPAWGGAGLTTVSPSKKVVETRSLAQVMAEEERQARAEQRENERIRREVEAAAPKSKAKGGVWGGSTPSTISSQATPISSSGPLAWGGAGVTNGPAKPSPWAGPSLSEANKPKAVASKPASAAKAKVPEKKKDEKKKSASAESSFISWFIGRARQLNDTVDGEVLATFIQDISNPDEVEDYMVGYLGEGKQVKEFVREYILKRSELRNKAKGAAPGPSHDAKSSSTSNDGFSSVGKKSNNQNIKKKAKFVVDSACLGFRPTGDPNRVNQGEIDHPETAARR